MHSLIKCNSTDRRHSTSPAILPTTISVHQRKDIKAKCMLFACDSSQGKCFQFYGVVGKRPRGVSNCIQMLRGARIQNLHVDDGRRRLNKIIDDAPIYKRMATKLHHSLPILRRFDEEDGLLLLKLIAVML